MTNRTADKIIMALIALLALGLFTTALQSPVPEAKYGFMIVTILLIVGLIHWSSRGEL